MEYAITSFALFVMLILFFLFGFVLGIASILKLVYVKEKKKEEQPQGRMGKILTEDRWKNEYFFVVQDIPDKKLNDIGVSRIKIISCDSDSTLLRFKVGKTYCIQTEYIRWS